MTAIEFYVGVDLHKAVIQICVLDQTAAILHEQRFLGETLEEGLQAVEALTRWRDGGRFAVEAVGFNRWFVDACKSRGLDVVVVDPSRLGLRMLGRKTDRRDAYEIARRLLLGDIDRNARSYYASDEEYARRKILRTRHRLVELRQDVINQIRAFLRTHRLPSPSGNLYSSKNLAALRTLALPAPELTSPMSALVASLEALHRNIGELDREILGMAATTHIAALIELPGLGPQSAATLVSELGDVRRFHSSRAVSSYAGLAPRVYNSADKQHHGPMTKRGNAHLRFILGQWAVRLLARNDVAQRWAAPMLKRMHRNKVRMALARRLLIGTFIMLSRGEVFSLERCLTAPSA